MARNLIALGGAEGLWEELEEALSLCPGADVGAVNEAGRDYKGHLSLFASLHPEKMQGWQRQRKRKGGNEDYLVVCHKRHANTRIDRVERELWSGTSGLYLCQVAAILGYRRIICCGMPMEHTPHYFGGKDWAVAHNYRRGWKEAVSQPLLKDRVRSMSGWTRRLLGSPHDSAWLAVPAK